jgi:hypothetical protein
MERARFTDEGASRRGETFEKPPSIPGGVARSERRSARRRALAAPVAAHVGGRHFARIVNLSSHGALAETVAVLRPSARQEIVIHFPDDPFVARATIHRCGAWGHVTDVLGQRILYYRSALEFDSLSQQASEPLERYLRLLDGAGADAPPVPSPEEAERARFLSERRLAREAAPLQLRSLPGWTSPGPERSTPQ